MVRVNIIPATVVIFSF